MIKTALLIIDMRIALVDMGVLPGLAHPIHHVTVVRGDHSLRTDLDAMREAVDEWLGNLVAVGSAP